jgi:hypothetical protein
MRRSGVRSPSAPSTPSTTHSRPLGRLFLFPSDFDRRLTARVLPGRPCARLALRLIPSRANKIRRRGCRDGPKSRRWRRSQGPRKALGIRAEELSAVYASRPVALPGPSRKAVRSKVTLCPLFSAAARQTKHAASSVGASARRAGRGVRAIGLCSLLVNHRAAGRRRAAARRRAPRRPQSSRGHSVRGKV